MKFFLPAMLFSSACLFSAAAQAVDTHVQTSDNGSVLPFYGNSGTQQTISGYPNYSSPNYSTQQYVQPTQYVVPSNMSPTSPQYFDQRPKQYQTQYQPPRQHVAPAPYSQPNQYSPPPRFRQDGVSPVYTTPTNSGYPTSTYPTSPCQSGQCAPCQNMPNPAIQPGYTQQRPSLFQSLMMPFQYMGSALTGYTPTNQAYPSYYNGNYSGYRQY
ncbi:hypothetical protein AB1L42_03250 [Thalassoglobus sp. JC818]|uniref:hypothetical protein n=1 Tax=Thalassoglobus sp. JC818 TaxID=3232136 RepID=UPI0034576E46